jgi:acetyl esterase
MALAVQNAPAAIERDMSIDFSGGPTTVRMYRPAECDTPLPCHVYFHGGGFFLGTLEQADNGCRAMVRDVGCAVVSVDYPLAPEHKFPAAPEASYAALCWIVDHAAELGIDPARISVGGGSAGGNLAAVVALMARDRAGPKIVAQVLEIPVTDFTSAQGLSFPDEGINIDVSKDYQSFYLRDDADARNPLASPLLAQTLEGLPPALVACAEYDQLQPEGKAYADRLAASGVPVQYRLWTGQFHGSQGFDKLIPDEAAAYRADISRFLSTAFVLDT